MSDNVIPVDYKPKEFTRTAMEYIDRDRVHVITNNSDKSSVYFTCEFDLNMLSNMTYEIKVDHGEYVKTIIGYLKRGFRHDVDNLYMRAGLKEQLKVDFPYSEDMSCNWRFKTGDILIIMNKRMSHNNRENCFTVITFKNIKKRG